MKRFLSGLLALVLVCLAVGCAGTGSGTAATDAAAATEAAATDADATDAPATEAATTDADATDAAADAAGDAADTSADAAGDLAAIRSKGTLVIGITIYSPMNYYDEAGKLVGFDTEFAEAVCAMLGVAPVFTVINWDTKEIELAAGSIDCIWNGLTVTEERRQNMDFSVPYLNNRQVAVIRAADAALYTDEASLAGAALVAEAGSAGETAIRDSEVLASANYTPMGKQTDALLEVLAGTADAAVLDYTLAVAMTGAGTDYAALQIVDGLSLVDEEYAIGFRTGSDLTAAVNDAIAKLIADGTLAAIAAKYQLAASLIG